MSTELPDPPQPHPDIDIGVALFKRIENKSSYTHWALVSVECPHSYSAAPVHLYQIRNNDGSGAKVPWFTDFSHNVMLSKFLDSTIIGVVHLGTLHMPQQQLDDYVTELGAGTQSDTRGLGWSNTSFIIRIVESLSYADILKTPSSTHHFRSNIEEKESMMEWAKSLGAHPFPIINA